MKAVGVIDGIQYGFEHILHVVGIVFVGAILMVMGFGLMDGGSGGGIAAGLLFFLGGLAVIYAGTLGMAYKVIADAVATGRTASSAASEPQKTAHKISEPIEE